MLVMFMFYYGLNFVLHIFPPKFGFANLVLKICAAEKTEIMIGKENSSSTSLYVQSV